MSSTHRRLPPEGLTPDDFFLEWLPAQMERLGVPRSCHNRRILFSLTDNASTEAIKTYELTLDSGTFKTSICNAPFDAQREKEKQDGTRTTLPSATPYTTKVAMTLQDWQAITFLKHGVHALKPGGFLPTDLLFLNHDVQELFTQLSGTVHFLIHQFENRSFQLALHFGDDTRETPFATLSTTMQTHLALLNGELTCVEAFGTGKFSIEGDYAFGIRVGMAFFPMIYAR